MQENEINKLRMLAYKNMVGTAMAFGGKIPKTLDEFWRLDNKQDKAKQKKRIEALRKAKQEYLKQKNGG